jgi:hypothetical protein
MPAFLNPTVSFDVHVRARFGMIFDLDHSPFSFLEHRWLCERRTVACFSYSVILESHFLGHFSRFASAMATNPKTGYGRGSGGGSGRGTGSVSGGSQEGSTGATPRTNALIEDMRRLGVRGIVFTRGKLQ